MIDRRLWWVGIPREGSASSATSALVEQTLQLQGIWTPPELRGRGLATASLAAICDRLLEVSPTLSLYVNDFNEAAIALYRRVGFGTSAIFRPYYSEDSSNSRRTPIVVRTPGSGRSSLARLAARMRRA